MSKWIRFDEKPSSGSTKKWMVQPTDNSMPIGEIKWYGPWRKYCFMPFAKTVFEQVCLRDIASFCEEQTKFHRLKNSTTTERIPV